MGSNWHSGVFGLVVEEGAVGVEVVRNHAIEAPHHVKVVGTEDCQRGEAVEDGGRRPRAHDERPIALEVVVDGVQLFGQRHEDEHVKEVVALADEVQLAGQQALRELESEKSSALFVVCVCVCFQKYNRI